MSGQGNKRAKFSDELGSFMGESSSSSSSALVLPKLLVVVFLGPPGCGKGTQGEMLIRLFNFRHISTGSLLREARAKNPELAKQASMEDKGAEYKHRKQLINELVIAELKNIQAEVSEGADPPLRGVILDGCRSKDQAQSFDHCLRTCGLDVDLALQFDLPDEEIVPRLANRIVHMGSGRSYNRLTHAPAVDGKDDATGEALQVRPEDSDTNVVRRRLQAWKDNMEEVLEHYRKLSKLQPPVNAQGTPQQVFARLMHAICTGIVLPKLRKIEYKKKRRNKSVTAADFEEAYRVLFPMATHMDMGGAQPTADFSYAALEAQLEEDSLLCFALVVHKNISQLLEHFLPTTEEKSQEGIVIRRSLVFVDLDQTDFAEGAYMQAQKEAGVEVRMSDELTQALTPEGVVSLVARSGGNADCFSVLVCEEHKRLGDKQGILLSMPAPNKALKKPSDLFRAAFASVVRASGVALDTSLLSEQAQCLMRQQANFVNLPLFYTSGSRVVVPLLLPHGRNGVLCPCVDAQGKKRVRVVLDSASLVADTAMPTVRPRSSSSPSEGPSHPEAVAGAWGSVERPDADGDQWFCHSGTGELVPQSLPEEWKVQQWSLASNKGGVALYWFHEGRQEATWRQGNHRMAPPGCTPLPGFSPELKQAEDMEEVQVVVRASRTQGGAANSNTMGQSAIQRDSNKIMSCQCVGDLHMHSTISDGTLTPTEVVTMAANNGVKVLSLTDHDTSAGILEAMMAGLKLDVKVIPGVELSAEMGEEYVHVLGYWKDEKDVFANEPLQDKMKKIRESRNDRGRGMLDKLQALTDYAGRRIDIKWETLLEIAGDSAIGRPHVAEALFRAGHIKELEDAYRNYLRLGKPAYVAQNEEGSLSAEGAVRLINAAGGLSVLAHPWCIKKDAKALVKRMVEAGMHGMETMKYSDKKAYWNGMADEFNLIKTGGSDYHGRKKGDNHDERVPGEIDMGLIHLNTFLKLLDDRYYELHPEMKGKAATKRKAPRNPFDGDAHVSTMSMTAGDVPGGGYEPTDAAWTDMQDESEEEEEEAVEDSKSMDIDRGSSQGDRGGRGGGEQYYTDINRAISAFQGRKTTVGGIVVYRPQEAFPVLLRNMERAEQKKTKSTKCARVLMVTSWRHGKWTKPAGSLEQGETPEQGVSREFWEEVGHKVTFKREHYLFSNCTRNILSHFYAYVTSDLAEFKRIADAKPPTHADETFGTVSIPIFYETSPIPRGWPVYLRENGSFEENGERTMRRELLLMLYRCKVVTWNVLNAWCKTAGMPVMSMQLKQQIEG